MDYKYLLFLMLAYSSGLMTPRVLRAAREGLRMLAHALSGVKEFDLYIKYRNDKGDEQGPRQPQRKVGAQDDTPSRKSIPRYELTEGGLTGKPTKRVRGVGKKSTITRRRRGKKAREPLR